MFGGGGGEGVAVHGKPPAADETRNVKQVLLSFFFVFLFVIVPILLGVAYKRI